MMQAVAAERARAASRARRVSLFLTGTDTGVGKTFTATSAAGLCAPRDALRGNEADLLRRS